MGTGADDSPLKRIALDELQHIRGCCELFQRLVALALQAIKLLW
jgi:hypothetical protein